jgi:negative regulator of flagellin synthesis FlgM
LLKKCHKEPITMLNAIEELTMVNQINDSGGMKPIDSDNRMKAKPQAIKASVAETATTSDNVSFSDTSKQLEAIKVSFKDIPEVNQTRVSHFKAEIEAGNYQINSDKIASRMLNIEMA